MKKFLISFFLAALITIPTEIFAADYETTHEFSAGDTISADMINEIFSEIEDVSKVITASDLVGTWDLVQTTCKNGGPGNCSSMTLSGMSNNADGLTRSRSDIVTMADDGDGTFSWAQTSYSSFVRTGAGNSAGSGNYAVVDGMSIFEDTANNAGDLGKFSIKKVSSTRYIMSWTAQANSSFNIIRLDKRSTAPNPPSSFTASTSEKTVSLAWTDNSTDETGFKVLRKDSLTGSYSTITTTSADAISYSDTVTAAGSYWYRVSATNSNGDSVGSKMVKVDVE